MLVVNHLEDRRIVYFHHCIMASVKLLNPAADSFLLLVYVFNLLTLLIASVIFAIFIPQLGLFMFLYSLVIAPLLLIIFTACTITKYRIMSLDSNSYAEYELDDLQFHEQM